MGDRDDAPGTGDLSLLRQVHELAGLGWWTYDVATGRSAWSDHLFRIYGFAPGSIEPSLEKLIEIVHPDDRARIEARGREVLRDRSDFASVYRVVRPDGSVRWIESSGGPGCDASGRCVRLVGVEKDVTDRKLAEDRASQLASIVECSNDAIFALALDGRILSWNAAAERLYGWSAAEALGSDAARLVPVERRSALAASCARAERGEALPEIETDHLHRDGRTIPVSVTVSPLRDAHGRAAGSAAIVRDVSERRRAAAALRRSEARFKALFESEIFGIVIGDGSGRIIDANGRFLGMLGYEHADIAAGNLRWDVLTPPEYAEIDAKVVEDVRTRGGTAPYEKEFFRKDRTRVPILMGIVAIGTNERDVEGIGLVLDLTRLKAAEEAVRRTEQQLRVSQKMEAIGRLAGGIAHDFNNILAAIMGYSELGLSRRVGTDTRPDFKEILSSAERARDLTRQLLAFGRDRVGEASPAPIDLNVVVAETERMLTRLIGEDVELALELDPELWPVAAVPSQLEQVVLNLALNARDAMPQGGKLAIATRNVVQGEGGTEDPALPFGPWVLLSVADSGTGMDPATLERIFEPFFTTKPVGKGTGLGLSTVYGIVKQSGGHISVASEPGRGTRFSIYLPRSAAAPEPARETEAPLWPRGSETVLLVEDDPSVRSLVRGLLEASGYRVLAASLPSEALALSASHVGPIELLLTDVIMPQMNGRQLAARILETRPGTRVLFMSGHTYGVLQGTLEPGTAFVEKPFTRATLARELRRVLDGPPR